MVYSQAGKNSARILLTYIIGISHDFKGVSRQNSIDLWVMIQ